MKANKRDRRQVLGEVAERVALMNEFRTDDFQDEVQRLVDDARESWREADGELPAMGADPMFDSLIALADESEGSPTEVRDVVDRALHAAQERARAAR